MMGRITALARAQWRLQLREPAYWVITLGLAVVVAVSAGLFSDPNHGRLGVVLEDATPKLKTELLELAKRVDVTLSFGSREQEVDALGRGERAAVIVVPPGTWETIQLGVSGRVDVLYDGGAAGGSIVERSVASELVRRLGESAFAAGGEPDVEKRAVEGDSPQGLLDTLFPGIVGMALMFGASWAAGTVVQWRQTGVLRRMAASPLSPLELELSQLLAFGMLAALEVGVLIGLTRLLFGVEVSGSYFDLAVVTGLGTVAFIGIWYVFAALASTTTGFFSLVNLSSFVMLFLGGSVLPTSDLPGWLEGVANVLPLTHLNDALRSVVTGGDDLADVAPQLLALAGWAVLGFGASNRLFRWRDG